MPAIERHDPGSVCWLELTTTDHAGAKNFYGNLFGWTLDDMPIGPDRSYTMCRLQDRVLGALSEMDPGQKSQGIPPNWLQYVAVENADDMVGKAKQEGAKVIVEPFDVFDIGRMAVLQDPQGATFAIWQAKTHVGIRIHREPHTLCWSEILTTDAAGAKRFYAKLFGWTMRDSKSGPHDYTEIDQKGEPMGGIMQLAKEWGNVPPHWMPYFLVTDCDGMVTKAQGLGAKAMVEPRDIEMVGRFAMISDPQGAVFSVIQPAQH